MQLVFIRHWKICEEATNCYKGGGASTLAPLVQEVLIATLQRVEALCSLEPRQAGIGLTVGPPSTAIMHLLQSAQPPPPLSAPLYIWHVMLKLCWTIDAP